MGSMIESKYDRYSWPINRAKNKESSSFNLMCWVDKAHYT